jgi:two-component system cell cycle sensor histidine kinase/response regulator CckA
MGRMPRIPRPREPRSRAVRVLVESALKNLGYRVRAATGGAEALRLIQYPQFPADLVITDVVMPKVGGKELSQKIRTVRPGVKILFISGYPGRAVLDVV